MPRSCMGARSQNFYQLSHLLTPPQAPGALSLSGRWYSPGLGSWVASLCLMYFLLSILICPCSAPSWRKIHERNTKMYLSWLHIGDWKASHWNDLGRWDGEDNDGGDEGYLLHHMGQRTMSERASSGSLEIVEGHNCWYGMEARLDGKPSFMRDVMGELGRCCASSFSSITSRKSQYLPSVLLWESPEIFHIERAT